MPRCLQKGLGIKINKGTWEIPEIFTFLQELGNVDEKDMYNVFNMGIGMILVVDEKDVAKTIDILKAKLGIDRGSHGEPQGRYAPDHHGGRACSCFDAHAVFERAGIPHHIPSGGRKREDQPEGSGRCHL